MATEQRETTSLIGSDKVEGTAVYGSDEKRIGSVDRIMIDKRSGKVAYAVMSFGGFLGIGEDYYPLPWSVLTYNPTLGGYEVEITDQQLKNAPKYSRHETWDWADRQRTQKLTDIVNMKFRGVMYEKRFGVDTRDGLERSPPGGRSTVL